RIDCATSLSSVCISIGQFFFFSSRRRHTRFSRDWSSDVCSSDLSSAAEWDNSAIITETLALRHELAQLLGFNNYAERSLATKMAESPRQVLDFLNELAQKSRPLAERDIQELRDFAATQGCSDLQPWDM